MLNEEVDFKILDNYSIHNINNKMRSLLLNNIVFFVTKEEVVNVSELEEYAFVQLIKEYLQNNRICFAYDYEVSLYRCKYMPSLYRIVDTTINIAFDEYYKENRIYYQLTIADLDKIKNISNSLNISKLKNRYIYAVKIKKTYRENKTYMWKLLNKKKVIIHNYIDLDD